MARSIRALTLRTLGTAVLISATAAPAWSVPFEGHHILVAGPSPNSPAIAREIYERGGNVVDAAVAVAFGIAVTHPYYAALGGGGFALVKMSRQVQALDFRETAPKKAGHDLFLNRPDRASIDGGLAVGVPGVTAGLWALHEKYGHLPWSALVQPALRLAEKGFLASGDFASITDGNLARLSASGAAIFHGGAKPIRSGDRVQQAALAKALRAIAVHGRDGFYRGDVAQDVVSAVQGAAGVLTLEDLRDYQVRWLKPLETDYSGFHLYLMPPPSSGGPVLMQAFRLMEKLKMSERKFRSVDELHGLIEIEKLSFQGRALLGDPAFVENPITALTDDAFLTQRASMISFDHALDPAKIPALPFNNTPTSDVDREKGQTTHISLMDAQGNAVALTVTLNGEYGSGLVTRKYGIALNNEMDDFTTHPGKPNMFGLIQGEANAVRAGARPLSSMSPLIAEKNGVTRLAIGSPGGPRIISAVFQVVHRVLAQGMDVERAIEAPRVHHQFLPNVVNYDGWLLSPETVAALEKRGHVLKASSTAKVYAVERLEDGTLRAGADRRGEGEAGGF